MKLKGDKKIKRHNKDNGNRNKNKGGENNHGGETAVKLRQLAAQNRTLTCAKQVLNYKTKKQRTVKPVLGGKVEWKKERRWDDGDRGFAWVNHGDNDRMNGEDDTDDGE